ncbi:MAG: ATP-binding cassette domain-containing protein, partial [Coriobacteriales bacterium]
MTFGYHAADKPLFKNLSLEVKPGEYVGIVGKTGCGKSTIMRLILGFETPSRGAVRDCDRILVLDGGRIAEEGSYDELMARNGLFAELVERQIAYNVKCIHADLTLLLSVKPFFSCFSLP